MHLRFRAESVQFSGTTGTMGMKFTGFPISEVKWDGFLAAEL